MKKKSNNTDEQIIHNLIKGDISAFNSIFDKYSPRLYQFALGYLKSPHDAEEIVQDVFFTIWEKRGQINSKLSFNSFLFTIAFNIIKKHFRQKAQFNKFVSFELKDDLDINTSQSIEYNSLKNHIESIVATLPEKRKEVFRKSRFEGFTNEEIAKEFNLSKKTVENHLNLALRQIKLKLAEEDISSTLLFHLFFN